jgi:hypothetical protein
MTMTVSDHQINNVIKTYMRNMKSRLRRLGRGRGGSEKDDVIISEEGMKRVFFERIGEKMTERLRRHDQEG